MSSVVSMKGCTAVVKEFVKNVNGNWKSASLCSMLLIGTHFDE